MRGNVFALALTAGLASAAFADSTTETQPAMGDPLAGLTADQLDDFLIGKAAFESELLDVEGLGPVFNKEFCGNCHAPIIGGPGSQTVTRFGAIGKGGFDPLEDWGGSLLQEASINLECEEILPPKNIANVTEFRITNGMLGYGLVEAILDQDIIDLQATQPAGLEGTLQMVIPLETPGGDPRVGRFGWKAQVATVLTFSGDAALNEMGLTNALVMTENDPNGIFPPELADCDDVDDPEDNINLGNGVDKTFIQVVTDFQRFLAPPPQTPKSGMSGEDHFMLIGCGHCHTPEFTTRDEEDLEDILRNKPIRMYSDYMLHDMGLAGDGIEQGAGGVNGMKTAPLSGLRHRDPIWHNGSIAAGLFEDRIRAAIALHAAIGSSAAEVAVDFETELNAIEQDELIDFLRSLGRREFDVQEDVTEDLDNMITTFDFAAFGQSNAFSACFFNPDNGTFDADHECAIHDIDQDMDVDLDDFKAFLTVYSDPLEDCNANGEIDLLDILNETSSDVNANGVPDECDCPDADGDGMVSVTDLILVITNWGVCGGSPCPGDINFDGSVDVQDLVDVVLAWGPCFE